MFNINQGKKEGESKDKLEKDNQSSFASFFPKFKGKEGLLNENIRTFWKKFLKYISYVIF